MCHPAIAVAAIALSTVAQISAQQSAAKSQAAAMRYQADVAKTEAALQTEDIQRRARQMVGRQRAMFSAAGVDLEGSPLDVFADTQAGAARDIFNVKFNAENTANILDFNARAVRKSANNASVATAFGGIAKAASMGSWGGAGAAGAPSSSGNYTRFGGGYGGDNVDGLGWE